MHIFWGHSKNSDGKGVPELLSTHLNLVSERMAKFMSFWSYERAGRIAGLFHDLGKYADQMQKRLENPVKVEGKNHAAAGAYWVARFFKNGMPLSLAILYHHGGLQRFYSNKKEFLSDIQRGFSENPNNYTEMDCCLLAKRFIKEFPEVKQEVIPQLFSQQRKMCSDMFDVRMVSSALDDADFIETEAHFDGDAEIPRRYRPEGPLLEAEKALAVIESVLGKKQTKNATVQQIRNSLYINCISAGENLPGLFTLTAPTGAGKTLSMLAFALLHAKKREMRRIVLVMPFLNIIDQTAKVYGDIFSKQNGFPDNYILEDHSLAGFNSYTSDDSDLEDKKLRTRNLLAENWDAPVVLTTSVKFFESLHACKNSQLRKLHRLAKSVILFDEAQSLPPDLAAVSLATLSRLADPEGPYGSSVIFATATQPAFESLSPVIEEYSSCPWNPSPLIHEKNVERWMFDKMSDRVQVYWREQKDISFEQLADEISTAQEKQCLCIVNLKRHACKLAKLMQDKKDENIVFHLSTTMCAKHREEKLDKVKERLEKSKPVFLISTQCIEAGVDISFPLVYRALAPLEAISQAAGRCNRHGDKTGKVIVFVPEDERGFFPSGYGEGISVTRTLLNELRTKGDDPNSKNLLNSTDFIHLYYKRFFEFGRYTTERDSQYDLFQAVKAGRFDEVSKHYKIIPGDMVNVLVPYNRLEFNRLKEIVQNQNYMRSSDIREWVSQAREYAVSIYRPGIDSPNWQALEPIQFGCRFKYDNHDADWFVCLPSAEYDDLCGLNLPDTFSFIC